MIELQRPHHFKPGHYNGDGIFVEDNTDTAKSAFNKRTEYDERKRTYCIDNDLPLEYIKYTSQKNYEELEEKIKNLLAKYDLV